MCMGCVRELFEDEGIEWDWTWPNPSPRPPAEYLTLLDEIWAFYRLSGCGVGGPLHVVLDDTNVDDEILDYCRTALETQGHWAFERLVDQADKDLISRIGTGIVNRLAAVPSPAMRAVIVEAADPYDEVRPSLKKKSPVILADRPSAVVE